MSGMNGMLSSLFDNINNMNTPEALDDDLKKIFHDIADLHVGIEMDAGCEDLIPTKGHPDDTGWDVRASKDTYMRKGSITLIHTGIHLHLPVFYGATVRPRSGLTAKGMLVQLGTIDHGYTGEIKVIAYSLEEHKFMRGDRVAQLVFEPVFPSKLVKWEGERETSRGRNGFGSTGVK